MEDKLKNINFNSVAMTYRHDFGLLDEKEKKILINQGKAWILSYLKEIENNDNNMSNKELDYELDLEDQLEKESKMKREEYLEFKIGQYLKSLAYFIKELEKEKDCFIEIQQNKDYIIGKKTEKTIDIVAIKHDKHYI